MPCIAPTRKSRLSRGAGTVKFKITGDRFIKIVSMGNVNKGGRVRVQGSGFRFRDVLHRRWVIKKKKNRLRS